MIVGEFQHSIEVKHNQEHVISLELSNLEIGFEEGRFLAQIKQVFKVFQGPQDDEKDSTDQKSKQNIKRTSSTAGRTDSDSESDNVHSSEQRSAKKRGLGGGDSDATPTKRSKFLSEESNSSTQSYQDSEKTKGGLENINLTKEEIVEIKEELPEIEEIVTAHQNASVSVPTGLYRTNDPSQTQPPFIQDIYSLSGAPSTSQTVASPSQNLMAGWSPGQNGANLLGDSSSPGQPKPRTVSPFYFLYHLHFKVSFG